MTNWNQREERRRESQGDRSESKEMKSTGKRGIEERRKRERERLRNCAAVGAY